MAEGFDGDWLDLREPFDAAARDGGLAGRLSATLPARPRLLDLGAGTGALTRWLGHYIGRPQAWTLVDADAALIERAFATIAERAEAVGWPVTWPGRKTLLVHSPRGAWRVEGLIADLAAAPANLPLGGVDAVVCTALCDLVSRDWVERMAAAVSARGLPFYAALNVTGRERFAPPRPGDALVARGFARDQRRDKGFGGAALGAAAPAAIGAAFARHGYEVLRAASDWVVPRGATEMAVALSDGHAEAAMRQERRAAPRIARWMLARAGDARAGRLSVRVGHADLLCLPPGKE
jgi:SAM-dependent methyltransferase